MKHFTTILLTGLLFLFCSSTPTLSNEKTVEEIISKKIITAYIPKGKEFEGYTIRYGRNKFKVSEDTKITILMRIKVKNPKTNKVTEFIKFSLSYDRPKVSCQEHGFHTYEEYSSILGSDFGYVNEEILINWSNSA